MIVNFSSSTSTGTGLTFEWFFGDGGTSTLANPSHNYTGDGPFYVTLTVKDSFNRTSTDTEMLYLGDVPVAAILTDEGGTGFIWNFDASDSAGMGLTYLWNFGDGSTSTDIAPSHTYTNPGEYTVTLTVTDSNNVTDTASTVLDLDIAVAEAEFTFEEHFLSIDFTDASTTDEDTSIIAWFWEFGDGGTANTANPTHVYGLVGTFNVRLTVTDGLGQVDMVEHEVEVTLDIPFTYDVLDVPIAEFSYAGDDLEYSFDASTSLYESWATPIVYAWDFGDTESGTGEIAVHTYDEAGTYTVELTVTDDYGNSDTISHDVVIPEVTNYIYNKPEATFDFSVDEGTVDFDATDSTFDLAATPVAYSWSFGATGSSPSHTYSSSGTYTVTLTVTDSIGQVDTFSDDVTVVVEEEPPEEGDFFVVGTTNTFVPGTADDKNIPVPAGRQAGDVLLYGLWRDGHQVEIGDNFDLYQVILEDNGTYVRTKGVYLEEYSFGVDSIMTVILVRGANSAPVDDFGNDTSEDLLLSLSGTGRLILNGTVSWDGTSEAPPGADEIFSVQSASITGAESMLIGHMLLWSYIEPTATDTVPDAEPYTTPEVDNGPPDSFFASTGLPKVFENDPFIMPQVWDQEEVPIAVDIGSKVPIAVRTHIWLDADNVDDVSVIFRGYGIPPDHATLQMYMPMAGGTSVGSASEFFTATSEPWKSDLPLTAAAMPVGGEYVGEYYDSYIDGVIELEGFDYNDPWTLYMGTQLYANSGTVYGAGITFVYTLPVNYYRARLGVLPA